MKKTRWKQCVLACTVVGTAALLAASGAFAATNQATYPGSGGVTLSNSGVITITPLALSIIKEARLLDGTLLPSTVSLAAGTKFYFVIYVDNTTDVALSDARIIDVVASGAGNFTVDTGTFQILNAAGPGLDMDAAVNLPAWNGSATWNGLTWNNLDPATGVGDQLDFTGNQVSIGQPNNAALNIPASAQANKLANPHRAAFRFQVTLNP